MNKNNNLKYILTVSVLVSTLIIGLNFDNIRFNLSMLDIYRNAKVEEDVNLPTKKESVESPLLKIIENEKQNTPAEIVELEEVEVEVEVEPPKIVEEPLTVDDMTNQLEIRSINTITKEYNNKLTNLQIEFEDELNILIQSAIDDYNAGISNTKLANKYIEKGSELEKYSDERVYALISEMEIDLKENLHNTTIIDEVKSQYETFKSDKKALLISQGMELVLK